MIDYLYALISGHPGGLTLGNPRHLHQDICKFHLPRANILPQKVTTAPPPGGMIRKDSQIVRQFPA